MNKLLRSICGTRRAKKSSILCIQRIITRQMCVSWCLIWLENRWEGEVVWFDALFALVKSLRIGSVWFDTLIVLDKSYSIISPVLQTYLNLKKWYQELREYCPNIPCILLANKVDVDYKVTKKAFKFPKENNIPFFFVSSADRTNVVKVFEEAVCAGLGQRKYGEKDFLLECLELFEDEAIERR